MHDNTQYKAPLLAGLYIVATPIGNLRDITLRALDVLRNVDIIACEDTRVSGKLLQHYGIKAKLISYHDHNEKIVCTKILNLIEQGKAIALISDAGTPLISDPGYRLVLGAKQANFLVTAIPGANAMVTALVGCGLAIEEFYFVGFLPAKAQQRQTKLRELVSKQTSLVFYEAPKRLVKTLNDMMLIFGKATKASICRELTKKFETYDTATLWDLYVKYSNINHKVGEIVIIVEARAKITYNEKALLNLAAEYEGLPITKQAAIIADLSGEPKAKIYKILVDEKNKRDELS